MEKQIEERMESQGCEFYSQSTELKFSSFGFEWIIKNYNSFSNNMNTIKSKEFGSSFDKKRKWYLKFYPFEISADDNNIFKISLGRNDNEDIYVQAVLYLSTSLKKIRFGHPYNNILSSEEVITFEHPINIFAKELSWENDSMENLGIICEIRVHSNSDEISQKNLFTSQTQSHNVIEDIFHSFEDSTFKDVTFLVQDREFKAHKYICMIRSKVFASILEKWTSRRSNLRIKVYDIEPDVFEIMLRFMYTDNVDDFKNLTMKLFAAAHKFRLKYLEKLCIDALLKNPNFVKCAVKFYALNGMGSTVNESLKLEFVDIH